MKVEAQDVELEAINPSSLDLACRYIERVADATTIEYRWAPVDESAAVGLTRNEHAR